MKKGVLLLMVFLLSLIALNSIFAADINTYNFDNDTQRVSIQGLSKFNKISTENSVGGLLADLRSSTPLYSGILLGSNAYIISDKTESVFGFLNYPEVSLEELSNVKFTIDDASNEGFEVFAFEKFFKGYDQSYQLTLGNENYPVEAFVNGDLIIPGPNDVSGIFIDEELTSLWVTSDSDFSTIGFGSLTDSVDDEEDFSRIIYLAEDDTLYFDRNLIIKDDTIGREVNFGESFAILTRILSREGGVYLSGNRYSKEQCLALGGSVVNINEHLIVTDSFIGDGNDFCYFKGSECPSGWNSYLEWVVTEGKTCDFQDLISSIESNDANTLSCPECDYSCKVLGSSGEIVPSINYCSTAIPYEHEDFYRTVLKVRSAECYANVVGRVCR